MLLLIKSFTCSAVFLPGPIAQGPGSCLLPVRCSCSWLKYLSPYQLALRRTMLQELLCFSCLYIDSAGACLLGAGVPDVSA